LNGCMPHEHLSPPQPQRPYEVLGLTEKEQISGHINQERFDEILNTRDTIIHTIKPSSNHYGEFFFITISRLGDQGRVYATFYGLGFHEYRERWITDEWFWYQDIGNPDLQREQISKEEVEVQMQSRRKEIWPEVRLDTQTERGRLFETLANLTDDDGALAEMEDMDQLLTWLKNVDDEE
jgi:hypothetical protein